ncbi:MAG TPA: type II secretion system protein GspC [Polyangiaceae bacterium]|nr:type II secretion system protein GspC [Polyangiaceae bacterium]
MTFDLLLKKYFLGVVLAFVALAAYFQAAGATQLIGAAFSGSVSSVAPPRPAATTAPASRERPSADAIIARNPFDSVTGPLNAEKIAIDVPVPGKSPIDNTDPLTAPVCDAPTVFIVTESHDPLWSVAALQAPGEPRPRMHRVGDDVGGKKVEFIGYNPRENTPAVWLSSGSTLCQAMLFKTQPTLPAAAPAAAAAAPPPPPPSGGPNPVPADIASKIQKVSDTEFNIDRSVVDKILENQAELMKSARIVPETKDGKVLGIRLFGIKPDTLLGTLGLQNGDRLESINGFNMGSPEKALEAYARLRTASQLDVTVNRRGAPVSIVHHIK